MEDEETVTIPEVQIRRLFAPVDEIEPVDVPGIPGAKVFIRRMDWHTKREWSSDGQTIRIQDGKVQQGEASVELHTADQDLKLLLSCLADWCLPMEKQALNSDETVIEEIRPPRDKKTGLVVDTSRRSQIRAMCTGTAPKDRWDDDFVDWLVDQCKRVNALGIASGNSFASSLPS